jgi:phosphoglycerate dehydrogenase-like enzyme
MRIVFHGENAASFSHDFQRLVGESAQISVLPDVLTDPVHAQTYAAADVIVGVSYSSDLPQPRQLQLFHVPGAGYDAVDLGAIPDSAVVCNCFGHEQAIAEYVMAALLERHVPLADADQQLRRGGWTYMAGSPERVHGELAGKTIGLLGFGHIGKAIATRAKAFEMQLPSKFPFHELGNVVMTPHMSGWTTGTINRRKQTIADNIGRRATGRPCVNVVRPART